MSTTVAQAEAFRRRMLKEGCDHVVPTPIPIVHPDHGTEWMRRGFCFNGSNVVPDFWLEVAAQHDGGYIKGTVNGHPVSRIWWDRHYRNGIIARAKWLFRRGRYVTGNIVMAMAVVRYGALRTFGGIVWARSRKKDGEQRYRDYCLPDVKQWEFPEESWMLKDAIFHPPIE